MNRSAGGGMPGVGSAPSNSGAGAPLEPTWQGYCGSTMDALYLIEWCLRGQGKHVPRRPHDRERADLIASGNIFIYEEHASGIKRWTDGVPWSPSRILGNFLIYRELDKPFEPGQKKKAKPKKENGVTKATNNQRSNSIGHGGVMAMGSANNSTATASFSSQNGSNQGDAETRALVGSLVDSYQFKQDGLIKKTISLSYNSITHHIVSYYTIEDVKNQQLHRPSETFLRNFAPRPELIQSSNFRAPVDDNDIFVMTDGDPRYGTYDARYDERYIMGPPGMFAHNVPRSMSVPTVPTNVPGLHVGYATNYSAQQGYAVQQSPTTTMAPSHGMPAAYSSSPSSTYPYGHSPMQQQRYTSQDQMPYGNTTALRRHTSVYDMNGGANQLPFTAPALPRSSLSNSTVLPSNGETNHNLNNGSLSSTHDIYGGQGASATSAHHGLPSFDSGSAAPPSASYNSQNSASSSFDTLSHSQNNGNSAAAVASAPDYDAPMSSTNGTAAFHPTSGGATPDEMLPPRSHGAEWGHSSFTSQPYQH